MKEDFLHFIWKYSLFKSVSLFTTNNLSIQILEKGIENTDAGPDFFNAKIKIGNTVWAGNVEIHVNSSDWEKHQHQLDKSYNNVILHVVYHYDREIKNSEGNSLSTLELKDLINKDLIAKYNSLASINNSDWIPCGNQLKYIDDFTVKSWLNRLIIERLERKAADIENRLQQNSNDWEETFYQFLFKYFGLKVNAEPFFQLASNTPLKIVDKHCLVKSVEALFFGQAGFLEDAITDKYFIELKKEYTFLKVKFSLQSIDKSIWKFLRLRPYNFPTLRISQLSVLLTKNPRLFAAMIESNSIKELQKCFNVTASTYWNNHYRFGEITNDEKPKKLGEATINNIIINVIVPFTFVYGKAKNSQQLVDKALNLLEELKPEQNAIIKNWQKLGVKTGNALHTQSLLELKNNYCSEKKCLNCSIGSKILQL